MNNFFRFFKPFELISPTGPRTIWPIDYDYYYFLRDELESLDHEYPFSFSIDPGFRTSMETYPPDNPKHFKDYQYMLDHAIQNEYTSVNEAIWKLYLTHQSTRKVGKLMGVTELTISRHLRRMGMTMRSRGGANNLTGNNQSRHRTSKYYLEGVPLSQWCRENNRNYFTMKYRIERGWSEEQVINEPVHYDKTKRGKTKVWV